MLRRPSQLVREENEKLDKAKRAALVREFAAEAHGYTAVKHQREVGTGYFDLVSLVLNPAGETTALRGSTEEEQF